MSSLCHSPAPLRAKGLPEKVAFWTILAFLVVLPAVLEVLAALRPGFG